MSRVDSETGADQAAGWRDERVRRQMRTVAIGFAAAVVPRSLFDRVAERAIARALEALEPTDRARRILMLANNLGEGPDPDHHGAIVDRHVAADAALPFLLGFEIFRPRAPRPIYVDGAAHLDAALEQGRGVIVWRMNFAPCAPLNRTLAELGHPAVHLSEDVHMAVPGSRLSSRVLVPLLLRTETRHLAERVVFSRTTGGLGYLTELKDHLAAGRVVTIVGDSRRGRVMHRTAVLGRRWGVPTGAASLAHSTGAPLLTALVVEEKGSMRVIIEPPIAADRTNRRAFRAQAADEFGRRLEARIRAHPQSRSGLSKHLVRRARV